MRHLLLALLCAALCACEYTVPLVGPPVHPIDRQTIGLWQQQGDSGAAHRLLILPLNEREALVAYPAGEDETMYARAALWQGEGMTLVQLHWLGTARGKTPQNDRIYQFARYGIEGDTLRIELLNPDVVAKTSASPAQLTEALAANRDHPDLFRTALVFSRLKSDPAGAANTP
jgi:hypothetical protein